MNDDENKFRKEVKEELHDIRGELEKNKIEMEAVKHQLTQLTNILVDFKDSIFRNFPA